MEVTVKLVEATPITGGLLFEMITPALPADPTAPRPRLGVRRAQGRDKFKGGPGGRKTGRR